MQHTATLVTFGRLAPVYVRFHVSESDPSKCTACIWTWYESSKVLQCI